jgi:hypothetical protein
MKKQHSKVAIHLKNQSTVNLNLQLIFIESEGFDANLLMNNEDNCFLLKKKHQSITTTINLTKITPYVLLQFNKNKEFTGATFSLNEFQSPFSLKAIAEYFLLLPYPLAFALQDLKSIS